MLHEDAGDSLPHRDGVYAFAHFDYFACSIGAGNTRQSHFRVVMAAHQE